MIINNEQERFAAVQAIEAFDKAKQEFEIGSYYQWQPGLAWPNQGKRHGPLKCVYVGTQQGVFTSSTEEAGVFENGNGLHIIATGHLKSGSFVKVD